MRLLLLLLLIFSYSEARPKTYAYHCDDGMNFVVRFEERAVWLFAPDFGGRLDFVQKGKDGETLYIGDDVTLLFGGNVSSLVLDGARHENCMNDFRKAIWEDAKLRGVDFRAVGNEPPWILEIEGDEARFLYGYGKEEHVYWLKRVLTFTTGKTVMEGEGIKITLERRACRDTMSGDSYETTVYVDWNGRQLHGCGNALH